VRAISIAEKASTYATAVPNASTLVTAASTSDVSADQEYLDDLEQSPPPKGPTPNKWKKAMAKFLDVGVTKISPFSGKEYKCVQSNNGKKMWKHHKDEV